MHIGITGPIATADIADVLDGRTADLPKGYEGAPLLGSLIRELLARNHTVTAFTTSNDMDLSAPDRIATHGRFKIVYCPLRPQAWRFNGLELGRILDLYRLERNRLQHAIQDAAPDVIHAHWAYEFSLAALATGLPHVITSHDSPLTVARLNSFRKPTISLYRWLRVPMALRALRKAQRVTTVSPYMQTQIAGLVQGQLTVVPNPVDVGALKLARTRTAPAVPRIAMICNGWDARKNPMPGLLAFSKLQQTVPGAELHLYGHDFGPGQTAQAWCQTKGLGQGFHFHGPQTHAQVLSALNTMDLFLHTSLEESFGMVLAEAMAMGIPVVAGDASGAVPWVVGPHGELCNVRNPSSVYAALQRALEPQRYQKLSASGTQAVRERFSVHRVTNDYLRLYAQAISS